MAELAPIPNMWEKATCGGCGADVRWLELPSVAVILDPTPITTLSERLEADGHVSGFEHRVGYQPHRCA